MTNALLPPLLRPTLARIEATATREHRRALARLERGEGGRGEDGSQWLAAADDLTAGAGL